MNCTGIICRAADNGRVEAYCDNPLTMEIIIRNENGFSFKAEIQKPELEQLVQFLTQKLKEME